MGLLDDLRSGVAGIRLDLPEGEVLRNEARLAVFTSLAEGVTVAIVEAPWRLDLSTAREPAHLRAIGRAERHAFLAAHDDSADPLAAFRVYPWKEDPTWTPVIEAGKVEFGGHPALRMVVRPLERPGAERIHGSFLIPVARGTLEVLVRADHTFLVCREFALRRLLGWDLTQAQMDDPAHDADFADYALARVRRALRDLEGRIEVTAPDAPLPQGPVHLATSRVRLRPPAGFLPTAPGMWRAPEGADVLARVTARADGSAARIEVRGGQDRPPATPADPGTGRRVHHLLEREGRRFCLTRTVEAWETEDEALAELAAAAATLELDEEVVPCVAADRA